jgi:Restriction endonuclease S subunits
MTLVPDGWAQHTPHEIAGLGKGALVIGPFGSNLKTSDYRDEGVPLVFVKDIRAENFSRPRAYVSIAKAAELVAHEVQPGDILITKMGEPPGDVALYDSCVPGIITADCIRLRPVSGFDRRFLLHALRTPDVRRQVAEITTGAAQQKVSLDRFRTRVHISAPPLLKQQRIAAALDQVDALRAKRREAIALIGDLTQSIFLDIFGDPAAPDVAWERKTIGALGTVVTGNTPSRTDMSNYGEGIEWVKTDNIDPSGLYVAAALERLSEHGEKVARVVPAEAILVTCIAGSPASIGRSAMAGRRVAINQQINAFIPHDMLPRFALEQLRIGKRLIQEKSTGAMTGLVNKSRFSSIELIVPPLGIQMEFTERMKAMDRVHAAHVDYLAGLDELFESVQQRAFAGQLWDHEAA